MPRVRTAVEKDISEILRLYEQLSLDPVEAGHKQDMPLEKHRQALVDINTLPGCELAVAVEKDKVIGTAMMMIVPSLSHGALPWAIIENVVVESEYRGTGVGKLLLEYFREKAKSAGCYKVQLMSDKRRTEAHKFYKAIGYNATAEGFRLYL